MSRIHLRESIVEQIKVDAKSYFELNKKFSHISLRAKLTAQSRENPITAFRSDNRKKKKIILLSKSTDSSRVVFRNVRCIEKELHKHMSEIE